jgi:hypothetical protein
MPDDGPPPEAARIFEEIGSLKQQLQSLKEDVGESKAGNKNWVNKWGAYLGILASVFAVPTGIKHAYDEWYQHSKVEIRSPEILTLTRDLKRNALVFSFSAHAANHGNLYGEVFAGAARLRRMSLPTANEVDAAQDHFRLAEEGQQPGKSVVIPVETPKSIITEVDFGENSMLDPGPYQLDITLKAEDGRPLPKAPLKFCFEVTSAQIENLARRPIELAYSEEFYAGCQVLFGGQT